MNYSTPEKHGISTAAINKYLRHLERYGLSTHSLIIARGDDIILERYWEPFGRDDLHRMYSVTKSFVAMAIGMLSDEGKISLDDPISKYFPDEFVKKPDPDRMSQTIRDMLMMSTAMSAPNGVSWFARRGDDRVIDYIVDCENAMYPANNFFAYDSHGSFLLGALVERLTGESLIDYLNRKMFKKLGVEGAYMLKCPGGHSWGDSALIMRPIDLLACAKLMMNGGSHNGEQIISREYVNEATSNLVETTDYGFLGLSCCGYGYQIWRTQYNSFFFNGMGCQFAVCSPDKDMILIYNGDNQGFADAKSLIIDAYFAMIYDEAKDYELPPTDEKMLDGFKIFAVRGSADSPLREVINGKRYIAKKNRMGITEFSLTFGDVCEFRYTNKTGEKVIPFGMCENAFAEFPEDGYSDEVGSVRCPGNKYRCAASAAFMNGHQMLMRVQIIDKYFGNLGIMFSFNGKSVAVRMVKCAEDFLDEYSGIMLAEFED